MEKVSVFLGGTCADSTWRKDLIPMLGDNIEFFNPQLPPGQWNKEAQAKEDYHREVDDIRLYVITPEAKGFYSFVEVTDDSNKRPERTVLCIIPEANGKKFEGHILKCALKTAELVAENGAFVAENLDQVAAFINGYNKEQPKTLIKNDNNNQ